MDTIGQESRRMVHGTTSQQGNAPMFIFRSKKYVDHKLQPAQRFCVQNLPAQCCAYCTRSYLRTRYVVCESIGKSSQKQLRLSRRLGETALEAEAEGTARHSLRVDVPSMMADSLDGWLSDAINDGNFITEESRTSPPSSQASPGALQFVRLLDRA